MIFAEAFIQIALVLIVLTVAFIMVTKSLSILIKSYAIQSLILAALALMLYFETKNSTLLWLAILTTFSKVLFIPFVMSKIHKKMKLQRELRFHYLSSVGSVLISIVLVLLSYSIFSKLFSELNLNKMSMFGMVIGFSLALIGLLIIASRKLLLTKVIGYLTMENGVLLIGLFVAELPFIIEILVMLDLVMLSIIAVLLIFGIDSSIEEFHQRLKDVPINPIRQVGETAKQVGKTAKRIHKSHKKYIRRHKEEILYGTDTFGDESPKIKSKTADKRIKDETNRR